MKRILKLQTMKIRNNPSALLAISCTSCDSSSCNKTKAA